MVATISVLKILHILEFHISPTLREMANRPIMYAQRFRQMMIEAYKAYLNIGPVYMEYLFSKIGPVLTLTKKFCTCLVGDWLDHRAEWHISLSQGFETRHGLMPINALVHGPWKHMT